jgi:transposase-like protein
VSRICQEIEQQVQAFLSRPLQESGYAYVYLDATYLKGRLGTALQVCSRDVIVAMGEVVWLFWTAPIVNL